MRLITHRTRCQAQLPLYQLFPFQPQQFSQNQWHESCKIKLGLIWFHRIEMAVRPDLGKCHPQSMEYGRGCFIIPEDHIPFGADLWPEVGTGMYRGRGTLCQTRGAEVPLQGHPTSTAPQVSTNKHSNLLWETLWKVTRKELTGDV